MVPIAVQKIIIGSAPGPSILVLQPIEESPVPGISRIVPIMVGAAEAAQLHLAVTHTKVARPTTHDLLLDALTNLDASVNHVLIDKVKGSLFFAKLTLSQHGRLIELDARPSDALSLALREDAPLYINEDVLERASYPYIVRNPIEDESAELELEEFRSFLEDLDPKTSRSTAATTIPADRHSTRSSSPTAPSY